MRLSLIAGALLILAPAGVEAETPLSFARLMKQCGEKVTVMGKDEGGKYVIAGMKMDDYCRGALEGMLTMLARAKSVCVKDEPAGDFLLSVVTTYQKDAAPKSDDAAEIVEAAFRRAFACD